MQHHSKNNVKDATFHLHLMHLDLTLCPGELNINQ